MSSLGRPEGSWKDESLESLELHNAENTYVDFPRYYDRFYDEKKDIEVGFIIDRVAERQGSADNILDLGCGTGLHLAEFLKESRRVVGVDWSQEMIDRAETNLSRVYTENSFELIHADFRHFQPDSKYDLVVSLYDSVGYCLQDESVLAAMETAWSALRKNGIFFFEYWKDERLGLGGNVWERRTDEEVTVLRLTSWDKGRVEGRRIIELTFEFQVTDRAKGTIREEVEEKHYLRMFSDEEIKEFLRRSDLRYLEKYPGGTFDNRQWRVADPPKRMLRWLCMSQKSSH